MEILRVIIYVLAIGGSMVCFANYRKLPKGFLWLGVYLLFAGVSQLVGFLQGVRSISNIALYNTIIIPYTLFSYMIFRQLINGKKIRFWLSFVFVIALILILISLIQDMRINAFSIKALLISSLVIVVGSLISLYEKIKNPMHISPLRMGWLWILMGFLFYYSSTFSYWAAYKFTGNLFNRTTLTLINVILVLLFYLILLTAIIVQLKFGDINNKSKPRKGIKSSSLLQ